ncbi:uncharacterized protein LJ206_013954 isoform 1-T1 [Theristicus caerulescens]
MAPAHRLLLILLLLVALHVRAAWAAPWRAQGADEGGGNGYPASRLDVGLEPLGHPGGPPRAKYQAEGGRKSPAPSEVVRQMLEELKRAHETDREAVQKEALPEGSGGSLPVSAEEREAMRAAGTPGNCRPVLCRCHPSGCLCVSRLFPQCPLLHVTSAAKAGGVLGSRHLDHIPQMVGNVALARTYLPL